MQARACGARKKNLNGERYDKEERSRAKEPHAVLAGMCQDRIARDLNARSLSHLHTSCVFCAK